MSDNPVELWQAALAVIATFAIAFSVGWVIGLTSPCQHCVRKGIR